MELQNATAEIYSYIHTKNSSVLCATLDPEVVVVVVFVLRYVVADACGIKAVMCFSNWKKQDSEPYCSAYIPLPMKAV